MSVTFGFFDSMNGDRTYSASDFANYLGNLISDGVIADPSSGMQVQAYQGMTIQVTAGWAYIQNHYVHNDTALYLTLDSADIARNRTDRIVIRLDKVNRRVDIIVKKGSYTEEGTPVLPALQRDDTIWELSLAYIYLYANTDEIAQRLIADERANTNVCGWVTGMIQQIDTTNLFAQYDDAFWTWFKAKKGDEEFYICDGKTDNIRLPIYVSSTKFNRPEINTIHVIGKFGIDNTVRIPDEYSMTKTSVWLGVAKGKRITLDFSRCDEILFDKPNDFALFQNVTIRCLRLSITSELTKDRNYINNGIQLENTVLENCSISGALTGVASPNYVVVRMTKKSDRCLNCDVDVTFSGQTIIGIYAMDTNRIKDTRVTVNGKTATGIIASSSYLSDCSVTALADENANGIIIFHDCFAVNCDVTAYSKDTTEYEAIAIYGSGAADVFLNGIRSVSSPPDDYTTTQSLALRDGSHGFYTGLFSPAVSVPDTVATNQPIKKVTQDEYDALTPATGVIYAIVG